MTTTTYALKPIAGLGETAALWLIISAAADGFNLVFSAADVWVVGNRGSLPYDFLKLWDTIALAGLLMVAVYFVVVVIVARWIYRASANAHAMAGGLQTPPPWAVGWFFIPIANFFKPYKSLSETWRASHSPEAWRKTFAPNVLRQWWGCWIVSNIAGNMSFRLTMNATDDMGLMTGSAFGVLSSIAGIGSALLLRRIVLRITEAQTNRLRSSVF